MAKKDKDNEAGRALRGSNYDPEITKSFVARVEQLNDDIQREKDECKALCDPIKEDIKAVFDEAETAGISPDLLKGAIKERKLRRDAEKVQEKFQGTRKDQYHSLLLAIGEFAETDLGSAAVAKAA